MFYCFFFFSSRRRHTRWPRDWSSDVCSSDLTLIFYFLVLDQCSINFSNGFLFFHYLVQHSQVFYNQFQKQPHFQRSEEHTSELQSRGHHVCRLLLDKKNLTRAFTHCHPHQAE